MKRFSLITTIVLCLAVVAKSADQPPSTRPSSTAAVWIPSLLNSSDLKNGEFGTLGDSFPHVDSKANSKQNGFRAKVVKIDDNSNLLLSLDPNSVTLSYSIGALEPMFWLYDAPTDNVKVGNEITLDGVYEVIGVRGFPGNPRFKARLSQDYDLNMFRFKVLARISEKDAIERRVRMKSKPAIPVVDIQ
jgi:hypothetical protein